MYQSDGVLTRAGCCRRYLIPLHALHSVVVGRGVGWRCWVAVCVHVRARACVCGGLVKGFGAIIVNDAKHKEKVRREKQVIF